MNILPVSTNHTKKNNTMTFRGFSKSFTDDGLNQAILVQKNTLKSLYDSDLKSKVPGKAAFAREMNKIIDSISANPLLAAIERIQKIFEKDNTVNVHMNLIANEENYDYRIVAKVKPTKEVREKFKKNNSKFLEKSIEIQLVAPEEYLEQGIAKHATLIRKRHAKLSLPHTPKINKRKIKAKSQEPLPF